MCDSASVEVTQQFGGELQTFHAQTILLFHFFCGQSFSLSLALSLTLSFSPLGFERVASALHAIPGRIKNRPAFHHSLPSFLPPSISAHRPLTTDMCVECVRSPSFLPPFLPPFSCIAHPLLTLLSCERSYHTLSLSISPPVSLFLIIFSSRRLRPSSLSCLGVINYDQSIGGDKSGEDVVTKTHPS